MKPYLTDGSTVINLRTNFLIDQLSQDDLSLLYDFNEAQIEKVQCAIESAMAKSSSIESALERETLLISYQRKINGILSIVKPENNKPSYDNQTVISTSSVRRKDPRDLIKLDISAEELIY